MSKTDKTRPTQCRKLSDVTEWHKEMDVAVIGSGGAGICAAIEAKEAGADVTIFEVALWLPRHHRKHDQIHDRLCR